MKVTDEKYYIDFDKLFENYADRYYSEHEDEYESPDDFAKDLDKVYHQWATSPQEALGGLSPSEFFNRIPTDKLIDILKGSCAGDGNPSSLLFDRIATEPSLLDPLCKLASSATDEKLLTVAMSLIAEIGGAPDDFYLTMFDRDVDDTVKEMAIEALCDRADSPSLKEKLLDRASSTDDVNRIELCLEPLTYGAAGDDRVLELLHMMLSMDQNTAYIAGLIGRYGDVRAAEYLYPLLDDCDYATFLEVRNAIEQLGGTVDEHYRDFSDDPMYKLIKG